MECTPTLIWDSTLDLLCRRRTKCKICRRFNGDVGAKHGDVGLYNNRDDGDL